MGRIRGAHAVPRASAPLSHAYTGCCRARPRREKEGAVIPDPIVRNLATIGGNVAHADPANDHPATLLAVRALIVARGPRGERVIPIDDFFVDTFTTSLAADEIVTEIRIPRAESQSGG